MKGGDSKHCKGSSEWQQKTDSESVRSDVDIGAGAEVSILVEEPGAAETKQDS